MLWGISQPNRIPATRDDLIGFLESNAPSQPHIRTCYIRDLQEPRPRYGCGGEEDIGPQPIGVHVRYTQLSVFPSISIEIGMLIQVG